MAIKAFLLATQFVLDPSEKPDLNKQIQVVIPNWEYGSMDACKKALQDDEDRVGELTPIDPKARMVVRQYVCYTTDFREIYTRIIHVRSES